MGSDAVDEALEAKHWYCYTRQHKAFFGILVDEVARLRDLASRCADRLLAFDARLIRSNAEAKAEGLEKAADMAEEGHCCEDCPRSSWAEECREEAASLRKGT